MKLYLKQKILTLHKSIKIRDEQDNVLYEVSTQLLSIHDKTHISNSEGEEIAYIHRKLISIHNKYFVELKDGTKFQMSTELMHLLKDIIDIPELGWQIRGNIMEHDYEICNAEGRILASTHRKWASIHESYEIDVCDESIVDTVVAVYVVLEHILSTRSQQRVSSGNKTE